MNTPPDPRHDSLHLMPGQEAARWLARGSQVFVAAGSVELRESPGLLGAALWQPQRRLATGHGHVIVHGGWVTLCAEPAHAAAVVHVVVPQAEPSRWTAMLAACRRGWAQLREQRERHARRASAAVQSPNRAGANGAASSAG